MEGTTSHLEHSESSATEHQDDLSWQEQNVRIYAKQMLKGRLFLGHYQEKRYVEPLQSYRDVIIVKESEDLFIRDLQKVRKRLKNFYGPEQWIGITNSTDIGAPNGQCLWVESNNDSFGYYWYRIKSVKFKRTEILIKLSIVRAMTDSEATPDNRNVTDESNINLDMIRENVNNTFKELTSWLFTDVLTRNNIKNAFVFVTVFLCTVATSLLYGVQYILDYSLKLIRELSGFMQAATPFLISIVNLFGKIIGGFYILIAMLWRKQPSPKDYQMIYPANNAPRLRAIDMPRESPFRQRATITEIG